MEEDLLVCLRNPHGHDGEWQGRWGDPDPVWTRELRDSVMQKNSSDLGSGDGQFFMGFSDFIDMFTGVQICHLPPPDGTWHREQKSSHFVLSPSGTCVPEVTLIGYLGCVLYHRYTLEHLA